MAAHLRRTRRRVARSRGSHLEAWELEEILKRAPAEGSVLVPAADGRGTNAALRRPANLFPLRFGNDSFKPHHAAAQATGKPCVILKFAGIGVDVDNPEDLQRLVSLPGETRAQRLARSYIGSSITSCRRTNSSTLRAAALQSEPLCFA
jgi:2-phospho-L-lactate guanylyltransferase (CobY/MobA/RfbA family)